MGFRKPVLSLHRDSLMLIVEIKTEHKLLYFAHDGRSCFLYNGIVVS